MAANVDFVKDTYIPLFNNQPSEYREWRKRIMLYKKKSDLNKKSKEATINLLTSLTGIAWRQVENLVDKATESEDGFAMILAELDKTFKYDDQVEMPRAFEAFFYKTSRRDGQTLINYVADHREALQELEKHGVVIPDEVAGWLLLRRAGLSFEQKQMIQGRASDFQSTSVIEALYFLFGQDYKGKSAESRSSWKPGKGYGNPRRWTRSSNFMAEEAFDAEEEEWPDEEVTEEWEHFEEDHPLEDALDDEAYQSYMEEYPDLDEEFYTEVEQHYEDAYATYLDARRQMASLKASRGFYPVVALTDSSALPVSPGGSLSPSGFKGGGKPKGRSKGKGKNKGGKSSSAWQSKGPTIAARGQAASKCLKCGQPGHWTAQCPMNRGAGGKPGAAKDGSNSSSKRTRTDGTAMMVRDLAMEGERGLPAIGDLGWYGIQDGGASSVVCGHETLMQIMDHMQARGFSADHYRFLATDKVFGFGGDASRRADWSVRLPCFIDGRGGFMECFLVEGATPLLIGRPILRALKIRMDYESEQISIRDGPWKPVPTGRRGEYLLRLDDGLPENAEDFEVNFDYVTDETLGAICSSGDLSSYIGIHEYLAETGRSPPERALYQLEETAPEDADEGPEPASGPEEEDPTGVRRPITEKLIRTMHVNFNRSLNHRNSTVETALLAHSRGQRVFWEVYSGSGNLSDAMASSGWEV